MVYIQKTVAAGIALADAERGDIECAHMQEDWMLWQFVWLVADMKPEDAADAIAAAKDLAKWDDDNEGRSRWYA